MDTSKPMFNRSIFRWSITLLPLLLVAMWATQDVAQDHSISTDDLWVIGLAVLNAAYNLVANLYRAYTEKLEARLEVLTARDQDDDQLVEGP